MQHPLFMADTARASTPTGPCKFVKGIHTGNSGIQYSYSYCIVGEGRGERGSLVQYSTCRSIPRAANFSLRCAGATALPVYHSSNIEGDVLLRFAPGFVVPWTTPLGPFGSVKGEGFPFVPRPKLELVYSTRGLTRRHEFSWEVTI